MNTAVEQKQPAIYAALAKIQRGIHAVGVGKVRKNLEQKFNFRGIDDALMAFAPLLTDAGVIVLPAYGEIGVTERPTKSGGLTYNVRLRATFDFIAVEDGSSRVVGPFYAEANDGQDKAISKATSVAYRNALFLAFCVPHEPAIGGDPDAAGEEPGPVVDVTAWADAITGAADKSELDRIAQELRGKALPAPALRNIRALWAKRAKELAA